jgi:hypothetical protein
MLLAGKRLFRQTEETWDSCKVFIVNKSVRETKTEGQRVKNSEKSRRIARMEIAQKSASLRVQHSKFRAGKQKSCNSFFELVTG